jgi:hypothetical protein
MSEETRMHMLWATKQEEIERLKDDLRQRYEDRKLDLQTIRIQKELIRELADALAKWEKHGNRISFSKEDRELLQRAREAVNEKQSK